MEGETLLEQLEQQKKWTKPIVDEMKSWHELDDTPHNFPCEACVADGAILSKRKTQKEILDAMEILLNLGYSKETSWDILKKQIGASKRNSSGSGNRDGDRIHKNKNKQTVSAKSHKCFTCKGTGRVSAKRMKQFQEVTESLTKELFNEDGSLKEGDLKDEQ